LGANGQLGSDLAAACQAAGVGAVSLTRAEADVTDAAAAAALLAAHPGATVINTTAWTDLPGCEREPARAFAVNALGALNVARSAAAHGLRLIHVSTDYVFAGDLARPLREGDARRGLNVYGASKLAGEDLVLQACPSASVVRVAGLYGVAGASGKGGNFVETMLRVAREGKPLRVIADQVTCPTNTAVLAEALIARMDALPAGPVHLAPSDACSWYDFARAIFDLAGLSPDLEPTTAAEYGGPVQRPACSALASDFAAPLGTWREGLERYLAAKGALA